MDCVIYTDATNTMGLRLDAELLVNWLTARNHHVTVIDWVRESDRFFDVAFFLERIYRPSLLASCNHSVGIFNPEWFPSQDIPHLPAFTQIWAKSREAEQVFKNYNTQTTYTGFLGRDRYDQRDPSNRKLQVFHLQGKSQQKNTEMVLAAWRQAKRQAVSIPDLVIVSETDYSAFKNRYHNVEFVRGPIPEEELIQYMNTSQIHLCPSEMEGFGHYIAEALSVGAVVVTVDRSPMNEHVLDSYGKLFAPIASFQHGLAKRHVVSSELILNAVREVAAWPTEKKLDVHLLAREAFRHRNASFDQVGEHLLADLQALD